MSRARIQSPATSVASSSVAGRASPVPSAPPAKRRKRVAASTETPPPGRGGTASTSARHRASSEMKVEPASDPASEQTRVDSTNARASSSAAAARPPPAAAAESGPSTPAGSAAAAEKPKKKTRRGWKGWAIEVVDEDGNKYIRSPSPEPEPDPNMPRRGRGRPRKSAPVSEGKPEPAAQPQQEQQAGAAAGASEEAGIAQTVAGSEGGEGQNNAPQSPGPAPDSGVASSLSPPPPDNEPAAPPPPAPEQQPRRQQVMSRWTLGPKRPREASIAESSSTPKRFRPSRGSTPPSYTEPPDFVMTTREQTSGPSSSRRESLLAGNSTARRGPGRPRKSESVKPPSLATNGRAVEERETPDRPLSAVRGARRPPLADAEEDVYTPGSPHAMRDATPASATSPRLRDSRRRTGRKSAPAPGPSAQGQTTLDNYVRTRGGGDELSTSSNVQDAAYPSPPESDERQEPALGTRTSTGYTHADRESMSRDLRLPDVAQDARPGPSRIRDERRQSRWDGEVDYNHRELRERDYVMRGREAPIPHLQEHLEYQERQERRDRGEAVFDGRHQDRDIHLAGPGQLRSREIQDHELRGGAQDRERQPDDFVHGHAARRNSAPRFDGFDARDRHLPDPRVNGHYMGQPGGPSYPSNRPHNYAPAGPPQSYGYKPGLYPAPPPAAPPLLPPPHVLPLHPGKHAYSYGPPISPREQLRNLPYDSSPRVPQDEWGYAPGPSTGYPPPPRGPTAPAAPPPLQSRRIPTQPAAQPPAVMSPPQLPPIQISPVAPHGHLRNMSHGNDHEKSRESRHDSRRPPSEREFRERASERERPSERNDIAPDDRRSRDGGADDRRRSSRRLEYDRDGERDGSQIVYTNVVPTPFPTGPPYRPPEPRPPKFDSRHPAIILAPPGNQLPLPTLKTDQPYAKDHARGFEGLDPHLEDNARGFVENVKNNLRTLVGTYFVEPSASRDAFLERIGRDLTELGWGLTDASDGALYSRGGVQRPAPVENGTRARVRNLSREWRMPRSGDAGPAHSNGNE